MLCKQNLLISFNKTFHSFIHSYVCISIPRSITTHACTNPFHLFIIRLSVLFWMQTICTTRYRFNWEHGVESKMKRASKKLHGFKCYCSKIVEITSLIEETGRHGKRHLNRLIQIISISKCGTLNLIEVKITLFQCFFVKFKLVRKLNVITE